MFVVLLVPFFAIVTAFVLIGLSQTYTAQHGSSGIKGFLDTAIHNSIAAQILGLGKQAARSLVSRYAAAHLKMLTAYLNGMASLWKQEFRAMRAEARATADVAHELERAIPREAHKAAAPALRRSKVANRHATRAIALGHANARELHRFRETTRARLRADAHAIDVTIPRDLAGLRARNKALEDARTKDEGAIASLEHGATETWRWIRRHPLGLASTAFAGAVGLALSRLGLGWLKCRSNPFNNNKRACGLMGDLSQLLGVLATVIAVEDFEQLVREMQAAEQGVAQGLHDLLNV